MSSAKPTVHKTQSMDCKSCMEIVCDAMCRAVFDSPGEVLGTDDAELQTVLQKQTSRAMPPPAAPQAHRRQMPQ